MDNIREFILAETSKRLDTEFLNHLAKGSTSYRGLYNLTHEVGNQYKGRFLIELLQNAHDALPAYPKKGTFARVAMILDEDEEEFGVLYVANDGEPFSKSNFLSLSQLAQSDKDPETNIGNKGIGFRSVLEISAKPQVFSRATTSSSEFDGFCFGFDPEFISNLHEPILALAKGDENVLSPLDTERFLVDWDQVRLKELRTSLSDRQRLLDDLQKNTKKTFETYTTEDIQRLWLQRELRYLSPYFFPLPLSMHGASRRLLDLQRSNFASVIRLPLKNDESRQAVIDKMREFGATTVLFLERLTALTLSAGSETHRTISRKEKIARGQTIDTTFISICDSQEDIKRRYVLWKEFIRTADDLAIAEAIFKELPEQWHTLQEISISVATPTGAVPEQGLYSVYLPTLQPSGCGAFINAPFYAKLDRTGVDFNYTFNKELANRAAKLAVRVACDFLPGGKTVASRAAVDLMAPCPGKEGRDWFFHIKQAVKDRYNEGDPIDSVFLSTDDGWQSPNHSSLIPSCAGLLVVTPSVMREHAKSIFNAISGVLEGRRSQIEELYKYLGDDIPSGPLAEDLAKLIGALAGSIFNDAGESADWDGFLRDVVLLLPDSHEQLKKEKIFIGTDGELHSYDKCTIFFRKVRGVDEDDGHHGDLVKYPLLQKHVAFLHPVIDFSGVDDPLYRYLNGRFVQVFRVENVLEKVLIRITSHRPVANNHDDSKLCEQILKFAIDLILPLYIRGNAESSMPHFRKLRVPCFGGWYVMSGASFGPGWSGTLGNKLADYLEALSTSECKTQRKLLLIPPNNDNFGTSDFDALVRIFSDAGVMNGLRLVTVAPDKCGGDFYACRGNLTLPTTCPEIYSPAMWEKFRAQSKDFEQSEELIQSWRYYQLKEVKGIPGLENFELFNDKEKNLLLKLIVESMPSWPDSWKDAKVSRSDGVRSFGIRSPLFIALSTIPWLPVHKREKVNDQTDRKWQRIDEGWLIPASILDGRTAWHYAHLSPFGKIVSERIDHHPYLKSTLLEMGLSVYNPGGTINDSRLLDWLAITIRNDSHDLPQSILVGQIREAWKLFNPKDASAFPSELIFRTGSSTKLTAGKPTIENPLYLPDSNEMKSALEMNELPIIEIKPGEAKNFRKGFQTKYSERIRIASRLTLTPLVDEQVWAGHGDELLADSDLDWLPPVLLTLVAHCGDQEQGVKSQKFIESLETLQVTRLTWVTDLSLGLSYGDEPIAGKPPIHAFWHDRGKDKVLILTETCRSRFFLASEALAKLLDRDDLRFPLRLFLKEFTGIRPEPEHIIEALAHIEVDEDNYREALDHWNTGQGLGQLIHLLQPFVMALDSNAKIEIFSSLTSLDSLIEFLRVSDLSGLSADEFIEMARQNPNPRIFGAVLFNKVLGDSKVQLSRINSCRTKLRFPEIENREAASQFREQVTEVYLPFHGLLAVIAARTNPLGGYTSLANELIRLQCPKEFSLKYWQVEFSHITKVFSEKFKEWGATESELSAFTKQTKSDFESELHKLGIVFDEDPQVKAYANKTLFNTMQSRLEQASLAWLLKNGLSCDKWMNCFELLKGKFSLELEKNGYLLIWSPEHVFEVIKLYILNNANSDGLSIIIQESATINGFEQSLGLSQEELATAQKNWEEHKEKEKRRRRLIDVCGKPFDPEDDNLVNLMKHICDNFKEEHLDATLFSLDHTAALDKAKASGKQTGEKGRTGPGKVRAGKETVDDRLVGLAGEIYVYRMLEKKYGKKIVHPGIWKSGNSVKVFDKNPCDDDLGYDFCFKFKNKTYYLEVKASKGDDNSFRLGTSEVKIARKLTTKKVKNEVFQVVHVLNALSMSPSPHVLPNPFEDKYREKFDLSDADVWVRYREKKVKK